MQGVLCFSENFQIDFSSISVIYSDDKRKKPAEDKNPHIAEVTERYLPLNSVLQKRRKARLPASPLDLKATLLNAEIRSIQSGLATQTIAVMFVRSARSIAALLLCVSLVPASPHTQDSAGEAAVLATSSATGGGAP